MDACHSSEQWKEVARELVNTSKKAVNWIFEMVTIIFETINISIRIQLLLIVIVKFFEFYVYIDTLN